MNEADFTAVLRAEGYNEALTRQMAPNQAAPEHAHEFDAKILVTRGSFILTEDGRATAHGPGDVFSVPAGARHAETAGPAGVDYLAGRRYRAA